MPREPRELIWTGTSNDLERARAEHEQVLAELHRLTHLEVIWRVTVSELWKIVDGC